VSALDIAYTLDRCPSVAAYARPRPQTRVRQAEEDAGTVPMRLELKVRGRRVTVIGERARRTPLTTARLQAVARVARTEERLRRLIADTPTEAPEPPGPDWSYQDGTSTKGSQYALDLSAWHRRYICLTDAPGRPR